MINYNPKDAQQAWDAGTYRATIMDVSEKTSKSGNEMYVVTFQVQHSSGQTQAITEYIVMGSGLWKLKKLADALGARGDFDSGQFDPAAHINAGLMVELEIEAQPGYEDRNRIVRYQAAKAAPGGALTTPPRQTPKPVTQPPQNPLEDEEFNPDDIPF